MISNPIQVIGVPLDLGASRRGTDAGPSALRIAGLEQKLFNLGYEIALEMDIPAPSMETRRSGAQGLLYKNEILEVCRKLYNATSNALQMHRFPLILGGDHSIAMGSVPAVADHYRQQEQTIGVIWFDAHGDMNTPQTSPSGNLHGMPLAHLLGQGDDDLARIGMQRPCISAEHTVLIAVRDIDLHERRLIRDSGIHVFTMRDIDEQGMAAISRQAIDIVTNGTAGFHISFDVDGCDPTVIPGSGTLVPGGVNFREAHLLLEYCADSNLILSMEVVELNPFLDQANSSAEHTVSLICSALGQQIL